MKTKYRIDRLRRISYHGRKNLKENIFRCRYFAKSQMVRYKCNGRIFDFINFRGSHFKKVCFDNAILRGCDFWGTTFKNCTFKNAQFFDCIFMACIYRNCDFSGAKFEYSFVINTNLSECKHINTQGIMLYKQYPKNEIDDKLKIALDILKENKNIRKARLLHLPNNRLNELNIFLLSKKFNKLLLPTLLIEMNSHSTSAITTYKKMELELKKIQKCVIIE